MPAEPTIALELDPTWKTAIEWKTEDFFASAFPEIHELIDWTIPLISLDAELQKLAPNNQGGLLRADKLFEARLRTGIWS